MVAEGSSGKAENCPVNARHITNAPGLPAEFWFMYEIASAREGGIGRVKFRGLSERKSFMEVLEDLVRSGKIRYYGWSTDDVERARLFAGGEHCIAIEHRLNVFNDNPAMLELCREQDLVSLNRVPLLMVVLTGRWSAETKLEEMDFSNSFKELFQQKW